MADPVGSIRTFSYLENRNLDSLDDGPGRGKQQHMYCSLRPIGICFLNVTRLNSEPSTVLWS